VPNTPALVIATRGAEPLADHGYRAALLLDGAAMLSRESIGALEDSLQAWESAIALLADDGTGFLTDVSGQPALAVSSGRYETLLRHEIDQRHVLRMPPSTRIASLSGPASVVKPAQEALEATGGLIDVLGPVAIDGGIRVIARFSYAEGARVTRELRAVRQKLSVARSRNQPGVLRVVVDNPDRLDALLRESD
jgi:primosomal protein N' (replication factor Y)